MMNHTLMQFLKERLDNNYVTIGSTTTGISPYTVNTILPLEVKLHRVRFHKM